MTLHIKEGGYYRNRKGEIIGPLQPSELTEWPLRFQGVSYRLDGTQDFARGVQVDKDLIAEVEVRDIEPKPPLVRGVIADLKAEAAK